MESNKLLALVRTFSSREWSAFLDFVRSPYFNRNSDLIELADWLREQAPGLNNVSREDIWQALYPERPLDPARLNHLMSWFLKLGEQFIGLERFLADDFEREWNNAEALLARGLAKHYRFNADRLRRRLDAAPLRDSAYLLRQYRLAEMELRAHPEEVTTQLSDTPLQQASDQLDFFYFTEKLRYACAMINNQAIVTAAYHFHFVDELRCFVEQHPLPADAPGGEVYFRIFQMLTKPDGDADFQILKQLLKRFAGKFSHAEMAGLYSYTLNYCIRQIRNIREEYVEEALQLYEQGIETGYLLSANGSLEPMHFKNIVKLALRLERFTWTERFILEKNKMLPEGYRADALHYNLADLYFHTRRYDEALLHLHKVEFRDIMHQIGAREMLAKIYYETDALDALDSLLHSFKIYLQRNRVVGDDLRKAYLNFIRLLYRLLRTPPGQRAAIRERIEKTDPLTAKSWLLEQLAI